MRVWVFIHDRYLFVSPVKPKVDVYGDPYSGKGIVVCDEYGRKLFKFKVTEKLVEVELTAKRVKKGGVKK